MEIGLIIAENLKRLREEQKLSQGQLAEKAGVSKVVISQIEKGDSNPTINTIWKLTGALGLPYTSLLEPGNVQTQIVRKCDISPLSEDRYHIYPYYPKNAIRNFEVYQIEVEPGCEHPSIGHSKDSFEYVMVMEGNLEIRIGGEIYRLAKDDALMFEASVPHSYINQTAHLARLALIIQYR